MSFLPRAYYLNPDDMAKFILAIPTTGWTWTPTGITWHNTGIPTLKEWVNQYSQPVRDAWGDNYDHYCKVDERWHSGPHFCGVYDRSIVLCEPRANGVHASCYNHDHFGVETVGDYRSGSDDPSTGLGLQCMEASANIIAALCKRMGWEPRKVINFHRECPRDGHPCPGNLVTDEWAIGLVEKRFAELGGIAPQPVPAPAPVDSRVPDVKTIRGLQQALRMLGYNISVDGDYGHETSVAVTSFQMMSNIVSDGRCGPQTEAAMLKAIASMTHKSLAA